MGTSSMESQLLMQLEQALQQSMAQQQQAMQAQLQLQLLQQQQPPPPPRTSPFEPQVGHLTLLNLAPCWLSSMDTSLAPVHSLENSWHLCKLATSHAEDDECIAATQS